MSDKQVETEATDELAEENKKELEADQAQKIADAAAASEANAEHDTNEGDEDESDDESVSA